MTPFSKFTATKHIRNFGKFSVNNKIKNQAVPKHFALIQPDIGAFMRGNKPPVLLGERERAERQ